MEVGYRDSGEASNAEQQISARAVVCPIRDGLVAGVNTCMQDLAKLEALRVEGGCIGGTSLAVVLGQTIERMTASSNLALQVLRRHRELHRC